MLRASHTKKRPRGVYQYLYLVEEEAFGTNANINAVDAVGTPVNPHDLREL